MQRRALLRRLAAQPDVPLVGVVAPAGYGKSTVLRQWTDDAARPMAWLTLEPGDNDPVALVTSLAAALDRVVPVDPELVRRLTVEQPSVTSLSRALSVALLSWPRPGVLVVDDVHVLEHPRCHDVLGSLVAHVPAGSQIALASRKELPLPIARLRAEGRVLELGSRDLAVDELEAQQLLDGAGASLQQPDVRTLVEVTEGWPVGVYLAGRSIGTRGKDGMADLLGVGRSREIVGYAHAELLDALPEATVQFLTRTSVLDRMSGPLCDAVLETTGSAAMLEELSVSNMLVLPLDRERGWYRYHHLFRQLLRADLEHQESTRVGELTERAAQWCEANGLPEAAVDYAMAAGDADRVARLVQELTLPLYRRGRSATLTGWLDWLDGGGHLQRHPEVASGAAWLAALTGRPAAAERWAEHAEQSVASPERGGATPLEAHRALLRALLCRHGVEAARDDAETALRLLPADSDWQPIGWGLLGVTQLLCGAVSEADPAFIQAAYRGREAGAVAATSVALSERALIALDLGDSARARSLSAEAVETVDSARLDNLSTNVLVFAVAARLAVVVGEAAQATALLTRAQRLRPRLTVAIPHLAVQARVQIALTLLGLSDVAGARTVLREVNDILQVRPRLGVLVQEVENLRARTATIPAGSVGASTLTAAELRLLPLLQTHLTFREIGERLYVSRHTVKTQAISIYRKLGVSSRSEAMETARGIGLLPQ